MMADKLRDGARIVQALTGQKQRWRAPTSHPPGSIADLWIRSQDKARKSIYSPVEIKLPQSLMPIDWPTYQAQRGRPLPPFVMEGRTGRENQFIEEVASHEGANENSVFGNGRFITPEQHGPTFKSLPDRTISEVLDYMPALRAQTAPAGHGKNSRGASVGTSAVGKGQIVEGTLKGSLNDLGIWDEDFGDVRLTPELQDILILNIAKGVGLDPNEADKWGAREKRLIAGQWESLDVGKGKISEDDLDAVFERIKARDSNVRVKPSRPSTRPPRQRRPKPSLRLPWQPPGPVRGGGGGGGGDKSHAKSLGASWSAE